MTVHQRAERLHGLLIRLTFLLSYGINILHHLFTRHRATTSDWEPCRIRGSQFCSRVHTISGLLQTTSSKYSLSDTLEVQSLCEQQGRIRIPQSVTDLVPIPFPQLLIQRSHLVGEQVANLPYGTSDNNVFNALGKRRVLLDRYDVR